MTCEELLKALNAYVDGEQITEICDQFADHLAGCNPCQVVVDNIRQTIALYKEGRPYPVPPAMQSKLTEALRKRWEEKFPTKGTQVAP